MGSNDLRETMIFLFNENKCIKVMICEIMLHFEFYCFEMIYDRTLLCYHSIPPYYIRTYKISVAQTALMKSSIMKKQWNGYIILVSDSNFYLFLHYPVLFVIYLVLMCLNFLFGSILGVSDSCDFFIFYSS